MCVCVCSRAGRNSWADYTECSSSSGSSATPSASSLAKCTSGHQFHSFGSGPPFDIYPCLLIMKNWINQNYSTATASTCATTITLRALPTTWHNCSRIKSNWQLFPTYSYIWRGFLTTVRQLNFLTFCFDQKTRQINVVCISLSFHEILVKISKIHESAKKFVKDCLHFS